MTYEPKYARVLEDPLTGMGINVLGPPASGKTTLACSVSHKWNGAVSQDEPVELDDIIYVAWDPGALISVKQFGYTVKYEINVHALLGDGTFKDVADAADKIVAEVSAIARSDENVVAVIHDTVSKFDAKLASWAFREENQVYGRNGEPDTRATWGMVSGAHEEYHSAAFEVPPRVLPIFLFHEKAIQAPTGSGDSAKVAKAKHEYVNLGDGDLFIQPELTGKAKERYLNDGSLELICMAKPTMSDDPNEYNYQVYPFPIKNRRAKSRLRHILKEALEPSLRDIVEKVREEMTKS